MLIGELSRRTGVSHRLLRYYEERELLHPQRSPAGYRQYRESDVEIVDRIRRLLAAGLPTSTIAEVLPCLVEEGDQVVPSCPEMLGEFVRERDRMDRIIRDLQASRQMLDLVISGTPGGHAA